MVLSNEQDEKGQWASYDAVHDVRQLIWKALLGWEPDPQAHEIQYAGGMLLDLNRHELYYQFDFTAKYEITEEDSRQQEDTDVLPDLKTLSIDVDFIEPGTGADGNIEHHTGITSVITSRGNMNVCKTCKGRSVPRSGPWRPVT